MPPSVPMRLSPASRMSYNGGVQWARDRRAYGMERLRQETREEMGNGEDYREED